jgi:hypothetical protein
MKGLFAGVLMIACGLAVIVMTVFVPLLGGALVSLPAVREGLEDALLCPGAASIARDRRATLQAGFETGGLGMKMSCAYPDGRREFVANDRRLSTGETASFGLAGVCGLALIVPLSGLTGWIAPRLAARARWHNRPRR